MPQSAVSTHAVACLQVRLEVQPHLLDGLVPGRHFTLRTIMEQRPVEALNKPVRIGAGEPPATCARQRQISPTCVAWCNTSIARAA